MLLLRTASIRVNPSVQLFHTSARLLNSSTDKTVLKALSCTTKPPRKQSALSPYIALTKPRLTALVVLSAMSSYALTPYDATLSQLMFLTIGTTLSSSSANAINMAREHNFDRLMTRTRTRPIVRGLVSPQNGFAFAGITGILGTAALYYGVNPTVAVLGAGNVILYGVIYTTLKRKSIVNTWVGAVVGAIPPLMGWAASSSLADPGAWCLAGLLYAWQFPHFNALSYSIREEYRRAGYVMTAWTNPALNARVALRYSISMVPLCVGLWWYGVTDSLFLIDSSLVNSWLILQAFNFWREFRNVEKVATHTGKLIVDASKVGGDGSSKYARKLFWGSVIHLPLILLLAMLHKKGQWDWLFSDEKEDGLN